MAEFNRNLAGMPFGGPVSSAEAAAIDAGLRSYMLRIYNYMVVGLVITAVAAFAIYVLSVTDDVTAAARVVRGGTEAPARLAGNLYLTPFGYTVFVSPLKWVVILAPF